MIYASILLIPFLALMYRCRGGFLSLQTWFSWWGTQEARLFYWVLPIVLCASPVSLVFSLACGVAAFVGLLIPHSKWMGSDKLGDVSMMGAIGLLRFALILAPLAVFSPFVECFAIFGALSGLAYWLGWKYLPAKQIFPLTYGGKVNYLCACGSDWGELFTGAFFGAGFAGVWIYHVLSSPVSWIETILRWFL